MKREVILPESEDHWHQLRSEDVTSTESACLVGLDSRRSIYDLWQTKRNKRILMIEDNPYMFAGRKLQPSIAGMAAEKQSWHVIEDKNYYRLPEIKAGTSLDYRIINSDGSSYNCEIKNVGYHAFKEWSIDGDSIEAPYRIESQLLWQMMVTGLEKTFLVALIGGNDLRIIERERDDKIIELFKSKLEWFWDSIEKNKPPEPDFLKDSEYIISQLKHAEPGKIYDATNDGTMAMLAEKYKLYSEAENTAKLNKQAIKAQVLSKVGDAEKVLGNGFSVSAGLVGPVRIEAHERAGFRSFKVNWKGKK